MKGLGRKHPANTQNKTSLIRTSHVCHRRRAARRNQQVEGYKHTHIQSAYGSKAWNGAKKANDMAVTMTTKKNAIKKTFGKRFTIPLYFNFSLSIIYILMDL